MRLTVDSPQPLLQLLKDKRLCLDPRFLGELAEWYRNPGLRAHYFDRENGKTIDGFGESLLDAGFVLESPSESEVIDLLDKLLYTLDSSKATLRHVETDANAEGRSLATELRKARANRQRAWQCDCGETRIRAARLTLRLTCGHCSGRVYRTERTVSEIFANVSLQTIQQPDYTPLPVTHDETPF